MTQASNTVLCRTTSPNAHASTVEALEREVDTSAVLGLSDEDAASRLQDGPNRLTMPRSCHWSTTDSRFMPRSFIRAAAAAPFRQSSIVTAGELIASAAGGETRAYGRAENP